MSTLTKRILVMRISYETGISQDKVLAIIQLMLNQILSTLATGGAVELRNFGVFKVKMRGARVGRNPRTPGKPVPIPSNWHVKFTVGKELQSKVAASGKTTLRSHTI